MNDTLRALLFWLSALPFLALVLAAVVLGSKLFTLTGLPPWCWLIYLAVALAGAVYASSQLNRID